MTTTLATGLAVKAAPSTTTPTDQPEIFNDWLTSREAKRNARTDEVKRLSYAKPTDGLTSSLNCSAALQNIQNKLQLAQQGNQPMLLEFITPEGASIGYKVDRPANGEIIVTTLGALGGSPASHPLHC